MTIDRVMDETHEFATGLRAYLQRVAADNPAPAPDTSPDAGAPADQGTEPTPSPEVVFAEQVRAFEAHVGRFQAHERDVARREREVREKEEAFAQRATERRPVRDALREHAELSIDRVFALFDDALAATLPNGAPDHAVRLTAVRVLLGGRIPRTATRTARARRWTSSQPYANAARPTRSSSTNTRTRAGRRPDTSR
jgi:hypothetical protein